ncbi:MAG TPA: PIN domain nuclease, partial [Candidatus Atribacteria bacterium]|nr:PIN domain nuclease [Candidatus Atribacteria bacterium]
MVDSRWLWLVIALIVFIFALFYFSVRKKRIPFANWFRSMVQFFSSLSAIDILVALGGLVIGLVIGVLLTYPISFLPFKNASLPLIVTLICGVLGVTIFMWRKEDVVAIFTGIPRLKPARGVGTNFSNKILDTSAIVDGRIADVCKTGFIEGDIL